MSCHHTFVKHRVNILVVSPFPYFPSVTHGGGVLCYEQLRQLASQHTLHFLSFIVNESPAEVRAAQADLAPLCASVQMLPLPLSRRHVLQAKLRFLTRGIPIDAALYDHQVMRAQLRASIAQHRPELVLLQFPQMAQYVGECAGVATALDVQDVFSVSYFRKFRARPASPAKLLLLWGWLAWVFYEARWYRRFDAVATLTTQDRAALEIFSPGVGASVSPAAVALAAPQTSQAIAGQLGFICSFGHRQNVEAMLFFIDAILPLIVARRPGVRLVVAGARPPPQLLARASAQLHFPGYVDDAQAFLRSCQVVVVPLLSGGGIKIKTLMAMACGCAVVATSIGIEEVGAVHGRHVLVANEALAFAEAVLALLDDPQLARQLGEQARALVQQHFSWDAKRATLASLFATAQRRHAGVASSTVRGPSP